MSKSKSRCKLITGQSMTVDGPCTIQLTAGGTFGSGGGPPVTVAEFLVAGAEVTLNQAVVSGDHTVEVLSDESL